MPAPNAPTGAKSRRENEKAPSGDVLQPLGNNKGQKASTPDISPKNRKKGKRRERNSSAFDIEALNPAFDPRMRRIGSPLNLTSQIRRGWIQSAEGDKKVNFLFNPSQLDLSHQIDSANVPNPDQGFEADVMEPFYASIGSTTGVKLLYDRTYELFSPPKSGETGFANKYGVWADVAAWYVYLKMLPEMPSSWEDSMIVEPAQYQLSYLFVGPLMVFYGWVTGITVTYSHFTQNMVPSRCAVDVGFQILPHNGATPYKGKKNLDLGLPGFAGGWLGDIELTPGGELTGNESILDGVINAVPQVNN